MSVAKSGVEDAPAAAAALADSHEMAARTNCIVYYNGASWNGTRARQRYLMAALSKHVPIVFLDGEWQVRRKITYVRPMENVTVVHGLISTFVAIKNRAEWLLPFLAPLICRAVLRETLRPYRKIVFWNAENWMRPHRFLRHDALVYDCIDPVFTSDEADMAVYDRREAEMLRNSARVFASAAALYETCRASHSHVTLLNNACEPADYDEALLAPTPQPAWWPKTNGRPIAGYLGSLDLRFDFDGVNAAIARHPNVHFILAGNVVPDFAPRVAALGALPNVSTPGRVSLEDGRYLLRHCDIGLIPFTLGKMNDAINPVKMYAYALLGKPMAGMATRELRERPEIVFTGRTHEEFSIAIGRALAQSRDPAAAARRREFALRNTWEERAEQAWEVVRELF